MDTKSLVKVGKDLFETKRDLRQGDILSCDLFNILMVIITRNAAVNTSKAISSKSHTLFAYAEDVDIIGRTINKNGFIDE